MVSTVEMEGLVTKAGSESRVDSKRGRGWRLEQTMTEGGKEGETTSGGGKDGADNRVREGEEHTLVMVAATMTVVAIAR